ncbi:C-type lectin domain family 17, member A [Puma concolor]|uniref:C-type lectin domain family 17, member A n=1 Tax=Puma concolor TaxID=9696 RepID=A0A6P6H7A6_PUMCO|nr:C-type lectin domain family 17, member A [Puma concolor]
MAAVAAGSCSRRGHLAPTRKHCPFAGHGFRVVQAAAGIREMNDSGGLPFSLAPPGGQAETAQAQRVLSRDQDGLGRVAITSSQRDHPDFAALILPQIRSPQGAPLALVLAVAVHMYTNSGCQDLPGTREEEEDGDDYENMAPPYKDLPPKPDSMAPPRPPRAGKKTENPPLPCKSPKIKGPDLTPVICTSPPLGVNPECPPFQPSLAGKSTCPPATPGSQLSQKSRCPGCYQEERLVVFLCLLVVVSLLLGCTGLAVTLIKYQEVVGELRMLTFQQTAWQASGQFPKSHSPNKPRSSTRDCFWDPEEPNNINDEDCASMNKGGTWNDLSCDKTTYWICERKCSC